MTLSVKQKNLLTILGVVLVFLLMVLLVVAPLFKKEEAYEPERIIQTIPDAEVEDAPTTKTEVYRRASGDDYWDNLAVDEGLMQMMPDDPTRQPSGGTGLQKPSTEGLLAAFAQADEDAEKRSAEAEARARGVPSSGTVPGSAQPQGRSKGADIQSQAPASGAAQREESPAMAQVQVRKSGAISSLDEDVSHDTGSGFSSLTGSDYISHDVSHPYKCMFSKAESLKSGQRVSVRLMEDLVVGGVVVPKNSRVTAVCSITDRIDLNIQSIEMNGNIYNVDFSAYDTDGMKGIYCSELSKYTQQVANRGLGALGSALSRQLGALAGSAAQLGLSVAQSKSGEITVKVPSGYSFYIIQNVQ